MKLLTPEQQEKHFLHLPLEWSLVGGTQLERSYSFDDFKQALEFVVKVGAAAEKLNHHPDIELCYGKADIIITTHALGGLTNKDFELAQEVEKIKR